MKKNGLLFLICIILFVTVTGHAQHHIIPTPVSFQPKQGIFKIYNDLIIQLESKDDNLLATADQLTKILLRAAPNLKVSIKTDNRSIRNQNVSYITLKINAIQDEKIKKEGYTIDVDEKHILIVANQPAGLFFALQTLNQMIEKVDLNTNTPAVKIIKTCSITDYPRFPWRGLMLDVSRHFFTKKEVMEYIKVMATYKFNTLHLHLADDQGWRVEIKSLPKLTEVGAWRVERFGRFGNRKPPQINEPKTYGGFYTHEDIREMVAYAAKYHISIVPEIDVPGHSMAALAAYPELSTLKKPIQVSPGHKFAEWYGGGKFKMLEENMLNPSDEKVYNFIEKIITEIAEFFPSPYIHVGGDECYHGYWTKDKNCQELMKKEGLKDGHDLQAYFMDRVAKIISKKGKTMIGWDEILDGEIPPNAVVMSWRGEKGGIEAAKKKHYAVMSPTTYAYLDYTQGDYSVELPIYADLSLKKAYEFNPIPKELNAQERKYILGGQGNLWSEQVPTLQHAFYMTYPRAFAIAESVWSPVESKNWEDFIYRTVVHFDKFSQQGISICKAIYDPIVKAVLTEDGSLVCYIKNDLPNTSVRYTTDYTYPNLHTPLATNEPVPIPEGDVMLRAVTYQNGKPIGRMLHLKREELLKRAEKTKPTT